MRVNAYTWASVRAHIHVGKKSVLKEKCLIGYIGQGTLNTKHAPGTLEICNLEGAGDHFAFFIKDSNKRDRIIRWV
jgi:hypothetical protein